MNEEYVRTLLAKNIEPPEDTYIAISYDIELSDLAMIIGCKLTAKEINNFIKQLDKSHDDGDEAKKLREYFIDDYNKNYT